MQPRPPTPQLLPPPPRGSASAGPSLAGRALAIVCVLLLLVAGVLLYPTFAALNNAIVGAIESWQAAVGVAVLLFLAALGIGLIRLLFAAGWKAEHKARQAGIIRTIDNVPIHVLDVHSDHGRALLRDSARGHYAAKLAEAQRPFPQLHSYHQVLHNTGIPPEVPAPAPPLLPDPLSGLGDAIARGWSTPDRWLVGTAGGMPQQIVLKHAGFIAISGVQGTGKTNGAAYLAAQCAAHHGTLYIADPHYGDDESLSTRIKPFSGAVARFAVTPDEINQLIAKVDHIYATRRDRPGTYPPLLLIIDEFMALMIRKQLSPPAIESLLALSGEGRKKRIFVIPIAQNWNLRVLGSLGVSVRQAVTHALVFRSSKETAELLLPSHAAQRALTLKPGQTLYFGGEEPLATDVPWLGSEDMQLAARGRPPTVYTPPAQLASAPTPPPLTPTERVRSQPTPQPAAPTMPFVITIQEQILDLLATRGYWMTASEIASALRIDLQVARTETSALAGSGQLQRRKCSGRTTQERYEYSASTNQRINQSTALSA